MSDSLPSHGLEPVRLLSPWNSPGRNTGVGSHFLLQRIFLTQGLNLDLLHCRQILYHPSQVSENESRSVVSNSLQPHGLYNPWNSPGQNTGAGGLSLLQGILPTRRLNLDLLHCRQILYGLSHQGSPAMVDCSK